MRIDPQSPRVLYFNDSVVVGWVRMGTLEFAALEPQQGMIFYTVDQRAWVYQKRKGQSGSGYGIDFRTAHGLPQLPCVESHARSRRNLAAQRVSVDRRHTAASARRDGYRRSNSVREAVGRLVRDGRQRVGAAGGERGDEQRGTKWNARCKAAKFETSKYPTPYSDIVALMVFEHQMHMMNLLIQRDGRRAPGSAGRGAR